jgi:hypothetical protein
MNYKLAKMLKDAGFPQTGKGSWIVDPDTLVARRADRVYLPTLSELIQACAENFIMLNQHNPNAWGAVGSSHYDERGNTPEEAVARLWLALNNTL